MKTDALKCKACGHPPESHVDGACPTARVTINEASDVVNEPEHYLAHPSGVECRTITRHMGFDLGNAVKYLWRADLKGKAIEDLEKAANYVLDEYAKRTSPDAARIMLRRLSTSLDHYEGPNA